MIIRMDKVNEKTWNESLSQAELGGTIFQSTHWAEYLRKTYGDSPNWFVSMDKKGVTQGLLVAMESCYAKHSSLNSSGKRGLIFGRLYKSALSPFFGNLLSSIYWENGPVIISPYSDNRPSAKSALYKEFLEKVLERCRERNCYAIKFARPTFIDDQPELFSTLGFSMRRMGTLLVDLSPSLDELWGQVEKDARRTVRRGLEQGVEITRAANLDELKEFYNLNIQASRRAQTKIYPFSHFSSLWNHFLPLNKIVVFIARVRDRAEAAALYLMHNKIIHIFALGDSEHARINKIYANEVLMWHIIKWAREQGFKYFDHSGVELHRVDAGDEKARSIYRFKMKWGGRLMEYHDYEQVLRMQSLITLLNRLMSDSIFHN